MTRNTGGQAIRSSGIRTTAFLGVLLLAAAVTTNSPASAVFYEPRDLSRSDYGLEVTPAGQMNVSVGDTVFAVGSRFSRPGGGMLLLGPTQGADKADRTWAMRVTRQSGLHYTVEGQTERYRLSRTITLLPNRVEIRDTLTNLTNEVQGVRFTHEVRTSVFDVIRVAGLTWSNASTPLNSPERPFVQMTTHNVSLGLVARDDVYRNQSVCYAGRGICGVRDDHFGLPPRAAYTTRWELYPVASADPFDFYNTVRRAWNTADARIPGLFAFVYASAPWVKINKTLADMSVAEMRDWLNTSKIQYLCFTITGEKPGSYAFGKGYLEAKTSKAYWRAIVERLRQAKPDLKMCPYFHMGGADFEEPLTDSRVLLLGARGRQKTFAASNGWLGYYYYATPTNRFGQRVRQVFDTTLADFHPDTFYWDEYGDGNTSEYMENVPDWDNCSVVIDPKTNTVVKKITNLALVTKPMRELLTDQAMANGRVLWTNWESTTEHDTALNIPHFLECFYDGQYAARGYLASPLQCGADKAWNHPRSNADVMRNVHAFLQKGLLYAHIINSAYAETTESLLGHFYPITPTELHDGYVIGKERIITSRSGAFGFGGTDKFDCFIYDAKGLLKNDKGQAIMRDGKSYQLVNLKPGEIAIIVKE